jgi:hypothetical protein
MKNTIKLGGGRAMVVQPAEDGSAKIQLSFSGCGPELPVFLSLDAAGVLAFSLERAAEVIEVRAEVSA